MTIITVGRSSEFTELTAAVARSAAGDEIHIAGALDIAGPVVTRHPLRLVGQGIRPVLTFRGLSPAGAGILTTFGDTVIENLEFRHARALTGNGAGLWHTGGDLRVIDSVFAHNQNGLMIASGTQDATWITGSRFLCNGAGCGHTHGIYASGGGQLNIARCSFEDTSVGHHVKSRLARLRVADSYFGGRPDATTSYAIDVADGGVAEIANNLMIKGRSAMSGRFIAYCSEGRRHHRNRLDVTSNIFISRRRLFATAVMNFAPSIPAQLAGNAYEGSIVALLGRGRDGRRLPASTAIMRGASPSPDDRDVLQT